MCHSNIVLVMVACFVELLSGRCAAQTPTAGPPTVPQMSQPARQQVPIRISVIQPGTSRLVSYAAVSVSTMDDKLLRRGRTRLTGEPWVIEQTTLNPAYGRLKVTARATSPAGSDLGTTMIRFDAQQQVWRPEIRYEFPEQRMGETTSDRGQWLVLKQYDEAYGTFQTPSGVSASYSEEIRVMIRVKPTPVVRYAACNSLGLLSASDCGCGR